jgi:hypothetical protein
MSLEPVGRDERVDGHRERSLEWAEVGRVIGEPWVGASSGFGCV